MKEIWQFLIVLFAGVVVAALVVFWMVVGDATHKKMYAHQVLLSPETLENLSNRAVRGGRDRPSEYLIESIRYTFLNQETKKWDERQVTIAPYSSFYQTIEGDRGVIDPEEDVFKSFQGKVPTLSIFMKHFVPMSHEGKIEEFQTIEFAVEGNNYRINLHTDSPEKQWVYFTHKGIGVIALETLKP